MREVVFTVSPNRQYLGIFIPTTPTATGPECIPKMSILHMFNLFHTWTSFQPTVIFHQYCKAKSKDDSRHFGIVKWFCSHYSFQKVQRFLHKVKLIQFCIHMARLSPKPKPELPWRKVYMAVNFYQCLPILSLRLSPGLWCILKFLRALRRCSDIEAISPAWLSPFGFGRPAITHHKQYSGLHGL